MIDRLFSIPKAILFVFILILATGFYAYRTIPKESSPEIAIPTIYITTVLQGISPADGLTQIAQPLVDELSGIEGLEDIKVIARQSNVALTLTFSPSFDSQQALDDVRRRVDQAKPSLPEDAEDPVIVEINTALFPIATVVIAGDVEERILTESAKRLQDALEAIPGVLEAELTGAREDVLDILINPKTLETYDLQLADVLTLITRNNQLIAAGTAQGTQGDIILTIPGLVDSLDTLRNLPVKITPERVLRVKDVAEIRPTFADRTTDSTLNGKEALTLDIKKRTGANVIETMQAVTFVLDEAEKQLPEGMTTTLILDESKNIKDLLATLESNVFASILLVMVVILWGMGPRNALLVGLGIPGAFLLGVLGLSIMGYTMNLIVLFALILVVGMLVDGTIVTVEYADTLRKQGIPGRQAFALSSKRMLAPVTASTLTTIAVFFPLLFWDQIVGEFMKYLPITVILTLSASLLTALVFVPILGSVLFGDNKKTRVENTEQYQEQLEPNPHGFYAKSLGFFINKPLLITTLSLVLLVSGINAFRVSGNGVIFFPNVEPDAITINVTSPDRYSFEQRQDIMIDIDTKIAEVEGLAWRSLRVAPGGAEGNVGSIQLTLEDWWQRAPAADIVENIRPKLQDIPGVEATITLQQGGPGAAKAFSMTLAYEGENGRAAVAHVRTLMDSVKGFVDIEDDLPKPGIEWILTIDRAAAAEMGADIGLIGQTTRLYTDGVTVSSFRPTRNSDSVDIRIRMTNAYRNLDGLLQTRIPTANGFVPLSSIATLTPQQATGYITVENDLQIQTITANLEPGLQLTTQVEALEQALAENPPPNATWTYGGDAEEQNAASAFLSQAFLIAIGLMFVILLVQFNSVIQSLLVLSAIVFSVGGVFWALTLTGKPFIIVMGGIGIISLAGLVINTNILLIDTWNVLRKKGHTREESAILAAQSRLRPIMLTTLTTILGLLPMAFGLSLDVLGGHWEQGAPATQWWTELAITICGGLFAGTLVTLYLTPALLAQTWSLKNPFKGKLKS